MTDKEIRPPYEIVLMHDHILRLEEELKAKEQECEFSNLKIIQLQETLSQYETDLSTTDCIAETCKAQYKELKAELQKYKDMEAKGLEEFKDIGGCWGCGIQSSLDEVTKEFQQYKKSKQASYEQLQKRCNELELENRKLKQTLNEIKEILLKTPTDNKEHCVNSKSVILNKISEVMDEEV